MNDAPFKVNDIVSSAPGHAKELVLALIPGGLYGYDAVTICVEVTPDGFYEFFLEEGEFDDSSAEGRDYLYTPCEAELTMWRLKFSEQLAHYSSFYVL